MVQRLGGLGDGVEDRGGGRGGLGGGDQRGHDALEGRDPHRAGRLAGQLGQVPLGLAELGGDALAAGGQQPPGLRGSIIRKACFRFAEDNSPLLLYRGGPR